MTVPDPARAGGRREIEVDGRRLTFTNMDKVLWPSVAFTKGHMISYYEAVAPVLLPHLRARPLTLKRYPDGVDGWFWFQTRCPRPPSWMRTYRVRSASRPGETFDYCAADDVPSLLWIANLGAIELHPLSSRAAAVEEPAAVVFDLDPGAPAGLAECCAVALRLRALLQESRLTSFVKTSGLKGIHVVVPLNQPHTFDAAKGFAREVAERLAAERPDEVTTVSARARRGSKVFVDWSQNNLARSTVAPYSLRAALIPTVSMPVSWDEVAAGVNEGAAALTFDAGRALERVGRGADLFAPVEMLRQQLPAAG